MYKPSLMKALEDEYQDAAAKFMRARDIEADVAEHMLMRMKLIGRTMELTQMMIDGTIGKEPLYRDHGYVFDAATGRVVPAPHHSAAAVAK